MIQAPAAPYPVQFDVEYAERQSRWKAAFRLILALPALLFAFLVLYAGYGVLFIMWIGILVRGRIPRWLFDFEVGVNRFNVRVQSYISLLTDVYPAWDGDHPARYEVAYPERVSRRQVVLWKFIASLPQWIVVLVLQNASSAIVVVGWFVILITGQFPKGLHTFVVGVMRWRERVFAYSLSLTDEYPPYSLEADATPAKGGPFLASWAVGAALTAALVAGIVSLFVFGDFSREERVSVPYDQLITGQDIDTQVIINDVLVTLPGAADQLFSPYDELFFPKEDHRLVVFTMIVENYREHDIAFEGRDLELKDTDGHWHRPFIFLAGGRPDGIRLREGDGAPALVLFEIADDVDPAELHFDVPYAFRTLVYDFQP